MLRGSFTTQFFVGPITFCSRLLWPSGPLLQGRLVTMWLQGTVTHSPRKVPWLLRACFHYFQVNAEAFLKVACFHYIFLLTGVTGSTTGCSEPFAMPSSWDKAALCDSRKEAAARLLGATCAQGNPSCGEHTQLFSLSADRQPQELIPGMQGQGKLLLPQSKPSTTAQNSPRFSIRPTD